MTALALAKRDLLGFYTPLWKILAPAVVIHGMANYRGMKVSIDNATVAPAKARFGSSSSLSMTAANLQVELRYALVRNAAVPA